MIVDLGIRVVNVLLSPEVTLSMLLQSKFLVQKLQGLEDHQNGTTENANISNR